MVGVGTPTVGGMRTSNWEKERRLIPTYSDQLISHSYRDEHKHYIIAHPALPSTSTHRVRILSPGRSLRCEVDATFIRLPIAVRIPPPLYRAGSRRCAFVAKVGYGDVEVRYRVVQRLSVSESDGDGWQRAHFRW